MGDRAEEISIVELLGWSEGGKCGYCKDTKGDHLKSSLGEKKEDEVVNGSSVSLGAWGHKLNVIDYQILLNGGWRRSGSYLYKPNLEKTCCPQYTIRLDVDKFILSRTQKRVLRNMQVYLEKGLKVVGEKEERREMKIKEVMKKEEDNKEKKEKMEIMNTGKEGRGEKKKDMRRMRAKMKWIKKGLNVDEELEKRKNRESERRKNLEDRIGNSTGEGLSHQLEIQLVSVNSQEYLSRCVEEYQLFKKYQESIHSDEDVTRRGFDRFLVKSPLTSSNPSLGSFHMRYVMDGSIIAVGVIDILTESVSAKYLFYDPDYSFLSLGTYTALREIELVRKLVREMPRLRYYYMGYYISDCPKMRYKGTFRPSDLLCDKSHQWVPLSECSSLLSRNSHNFTIFRPSLPEAIRFNPMDAKLYLSRGITTFNSLPPVIQLKITDKLQSFCSFVTRDASNLVLVLKELQIEDDSDDED
ncbi:ate-1 [Pristionchus pacificus]|nr:ate-1 [Pristionchus pacificus]